MFRIKSFVSAVIMVVVLSTGAQAGSQVLTFDSNNWGTSTWGTYNTIRSFESSGGNPGACLLLRGISGVGASFSNAGFTGDFAAAGYGRIAFDIKVWQKDLAVKAGQGQSVRDSIESWRSPEALTWEAWLAGQDLYDKISSLNEKRLPPQTVAEFIRQESLYQPDINDGVRVNIAPLQRAGLLTADVLAGKDVEKAIADRAAWRDDERRWCREGKLPKPGWWD